MVTILAVRVLRVIGIAALLAFPVAGFAAHPSRPSSRDQALRDGC
jgi:hypothetical protein